VVWGEIQVCGPYTGDNPPEDCYGDPKVFTEITCVLIRDSGDDGGGDGEGNGGCPNGCDTGGSSGDDEEEDSDDEITFQFSCPDKDVVRGAVTGCTVTVEYPEGVDEKQYTFKWSSNVGASLESTDAKGSRWDGVAIETTIITLKIESEKYKKSAKIRVKPREISEYSIPALKVADKEIQYSAHPMTLGYEGFYYAVEASAPVSTSRAGTGPWTGKFMTGDISKVTFSSELHVSENYKEPGPAYRASNNVSDIDNHGCPAASDLDNSAQSYYSVNDHCNTLSGFRAMKVAIIEHERRHESSFNKCLSETTIYSRLEGIVDKSSGIVTKTITDLWKEFGNEFHASGDYARGYAGVQSWFFMIGSSWTRSAHGLEGHGGLRRSKCS